MVTLLLYGLLAVALMVGLFLLAVRFLPAGEQIAPAARDEPVWTLPADRTLTAGDIEELRLPVALRGYRFAETDELLDRMVEEVRKRDDELERLYGLLISMPVSVDVPAAQPDADDTQVAEPEAAEDAEPEAADAAEPEAVETEDAEHDG